MLAPSTLAPGPARSPRGLLPLLTGVEILLTAVELAAVILPLFAFFPTTRRPEVLTAVALMLLVWVGAAACWLRPILAGVRPDQFVRVYRLAQRLPGRLLWFRTCGWIAVAAYAVLLIQTTLPRGWWPVGALLGICLVHSFGASLIRWSLQQRLMRWAITTMHLEPSWLQLQADTLFQRLVEVSLVLGALTAGFLAIFVPLFVPISAHQFLLLETVVPWTALLLGLSWYLLTSRRPVASIVGYFRAAVAGGGQELLLPAVRAAHRLPTQLALIKLAFFSATGLALGLEAIGMLDYSVHQGVLLFATILIVTCGTAVYELIWSRNLLRPIVAHLMAQPGALNIEIRAPSLNRKLLLSFSGVLVFTVVLPLFWTYLQQQGGPHRGFASAVFFFATVLAIALGVIWLTSIDLARPLAALEQRATEMAQGKLDRPVLPGGESDEVGRLTLAFEAMRRALLGKIRTIEEMNVGLEEKVRERTAELSQANRELSSAITALKQAQHRLVLTEKMASVGQLVAGIAHEIGNPLNAVINTVEPLAETVRELCDGGAPAEPKQELEAMVRVIRSAAQRTQRIVQALRNFSRQDGEALSQVELHNEIEETLALLQHELRSVRVERELASSGTLVAYRGQLNQAIVNLLTNAIGAVEGRGDACIRIRTRDENGEVVIEIEDNGPGIPDAVLPRIFDPFFTTKEVGKGTGLGLSITHDIVSRHSGRVEVTRTGREGTTFAIRIPRAGPPR